VKGNDCSGGKRKKTIEGVSAIVDRARGGWGGSERLQTRGGGEGKLGVLARPNKKNRLKRKGTKPKKDLRDNRTLARSETRGLRQEGGRRRRQWPTWPSKESRAGGVLLRPLSKGGVGKKRNNNRLLPNEQFSGK